MRSRPIAALAATAVAIALGACSAPSNQSTDGTQTVTFWQFDTAAPTIEAYKNAIKEFESRNSDIKIDMQIVPWADQQQKLTTALASGALPDVSMLGNNVVAQYASSGALKPLDSYLDGWTKAEGQDITADMYEGDRSYYTFDGKLYGMPVADETRMVYYNKALFEQAGLDVAKPPATWAEMQQAAEALKSTGKVPWAAPMSNQYLTVQTFMSVYLSYGAQLFNDAGQCGLDTPEFKDALGYYAGIAKAGLTTTDAANQSQADFTNLFMSGGAGMLIEGPGVYEQIKQQNPELVKDVGIAPIPSGPKGQFGLFTDGGG